MAAPAATLVEPRATGFGGPTRSDRDARARSDREAVEIRRAFGPPNL